MTFPERIGRYHIVGYLAAGGMAEILLGKLLGPGGFEQAVVIKRALPHLARQSEFRDMFLDEARVVARIQHPNVVSVTELGEDDEHLFMVMEYLAGESVVGLVKRLGTRGEELPLDVALYIVTQVLAGLHAAHELTDEDGAPLQLVHRDVSPQNLLVTYDGRVKLLDFGIAKFHDRSVETSTGHLKGKFAYMSPEQCTDDVIDRRSDVFSTGIVLWELLARERLFKRANELLCWKAIVEDPTPRLADHVPDDLRPLPEGLDDIVMRALAKSPDGRPATAADLRRDLLGVLREIDPSEKAKDRLVALMEACFEDRIAEKRELLRRVRSGDTVTSIPSAEVDVDEAIEPTVAAPQVPAATRAPTGVPRWGIAAGVGLAVVALVGLVLVLAAEPPAGGATPTAAPPVTVLPTAPPARPALQLPPALPPAPPPTTEPVPDLTIVVEMQTSPPGAQVVDAQDEVRCETPCRVELPRGDEEVTLRLRLAGYQERAETLVPDMNQRVRASLVRARVPRDRPRPTEGPAPEPGFFRFD
ncbi:MAG: serine/threonine protein kinase [Sandaracinaceae bacterium]|nr:serine/threonine protein kinase [Sandaracinaceae bacterium]